MKTLIICLAAFMVMSVSAPVNGQVTTKELKKELKSKAIRKARQECRDMERNGYSVAPGALPLDKQLEKAWLRELEVNEKGYPQYIVATGISVGESQIAAKMQAIEAAKLELAGSIATEIAALIENNLANQQLNTDEAASVTKTVAASKNIIAQELGRTLPLLEVYRKGNQNVEVSLRLAYDSRLAMEAGKEVIRKRLQEETNILQEKLDNLMKFDTL